MSSVSCGETGLMATRQLTHTHTCPQQSVPTRDEKYSQEMKTPKTYVLKQ